MQDLNEIRVFTQVIKAGSFTQAAKSLGLPKSTVSRRVSQLESRLGVSLIQRTTRQLNLTEVGERYFRECARILSELEQAESAATITQAVPRGTLKVTAPIELGTSLLADCVEQFTRNNPYVNVELILTDRIVDLVGEGIDLAIRAGHLADSGLMARKIGVDEFHLHASPAYLKKHGEPAQPRDLAHHRCLRFTMDGSDDSWTLIPTKGGGTATKQQVRPPGQLSANSLSMLRLLALRGSGIALLPAFLCREDLRTGKLRRVLKEWSSERSPVHLVYPARRFVPPKLKAFVDHVHEYAASDAWFGRAP